MLNKEEELQIREQAKMFGENPDLAVLKNDRAYEELWGGCFYNYDSEKVDRIYSRKKDKVYIINTEKTKWDGVLLIQYIDDFYNIINVGYIKEDLTGYSELIKGGKFFLIGIIESLNIIRMREEQNKKNDIFGFFS